MSDEPFAPPAGERADPVGRIGGALIPWALAGAVGGTAVGFTLHMTRQAEGWSAVAALAGVVAAVGTGWVAVRMDRARQARLPPIPGGPAAWPIHGAVTAVPLVALIPIALWLGVAAAVGLRTLAPVGVAGVAVVGVAWALVRVWSDHRLVVALQAQALDRPDDARQALATLAQHPLATARARKVARRNLGALLLARGELSSAAHWFAQVPDSAVAGAGLAIARVGLGQLEAARDAVEQATGCPDVGRARAELDAARVLVVWRTEGTAAARVLADRLDGPGSGRLFRDLHGLLRGEDPAPGPLLAKLRPVLGLGTVA